ncbi:MAG: J domain-containing protein [Burkholderiaceae bacterium]
MTINAYPLHWPPSFPRAKLREKGAFKSTLHAALTNVQDSLRKFAADSGKKLEGLVMSSNVTLGEQRPADPGVAVWFTWDGMGVCIAVDRYLTVEANLQAIHHIIEARRVELRHGTLALVRATFAGFLALPAPKGAHWTEVLGIAKGARREDVKQAYRRLASAHHPDKGGSEEKMAALNVAFEAALGECAD